jgi:hypothetical protein
MAAFFVDTDSIQSALETAAIDLQTHFLQEEGEVYRVEDLQQALESWLELSVESLVEDALFHAVEGDRSVAFNRSAFESQLKRVKPLALQESRMIQQTANAA